MRKGGICRSASSGRLHRDALVADEGEPQILIRALHPRMGLFARVAPRLLLALPVKPVWRYISA